MVKKINPSATFRIGGERSRAVNYGKVAVVIFITVLIWVWADLALDEEFSVSSATISVAKSANPSLWASFDDEPSVSIAKIVLRGPASRIADVKRRLNDGSLVLEFFLDPEQEAMTAARQYTLTMLDFLKRSDQLKQLGLAVESCEPETLTVDVVELVKKPLDVICVDENRNPVKAVIEPAQVDTFVPADWAGEKLITQVQLTRAEIDQARVTAIEKVPYIELAAGQTREALKPVKITTPPQQDPRGDYLITATLGIALSPTLQGKYGVEVTNLDAVMSAIAIRATPEAKRAYELQPFPTMTLYILDDDKKTTDQIRRKVVYNFPEEFVSKGEIVLNQQPVTARFKLVSLSGQPQPGTGP